MPLESFFYFSFIQLLHFTPTEVIHFRNSHEKNIHVQDFTTYALFSYTLVAIEITEIECCGVKFLSDTVSIIKMFHWDS